MAERSLIGPALPEHLRHSSQEAEDDMNVKTIVNESDSSIIGPALPPHLTKKFRDNSTFSDSSNDGPALPPYSGVCGPTLPPHLLKNKCDNNSEDDINDGLANVPMPPPELDSSDTYGPVLPPHLRNRVTLGPTLPSHMQQMEDSDSSDSGDDVVGPVPEDGKMTFVQQQLEIRAQHLKRKMNEEGNHENDKVKRESWMLELPPEKAVNLGLGPRSFRMKEGPDMSDRSEWTDTPADKIRKALLGQSGSDGGMNEADLKSATIGERDRAMEKMAESCKDDKRQLSLLEMHQKERRKKQKKEEKERKGEKPERRPFDRDIDLQANRFDEAQKKSIFKKAQLLDTRFSQGQSKYL